MAPSALFVVVKFSLEEHFRPMTSHIASVYSEQPLHNISRPLAPPVPLAHVLSPLQKTCCPSAFQDFLFIHKKPPRSPQIE